MQRKLVGVPSIFGRHCRSSGPRLGGSQDELARGESSRFDWARVESALA